MEDTAPKIVTVSPSDLRPHKTTKKANNNGCVMIQSEDVGDFYFFTVKDDGKGIRPQFHKKVFELFQTLQSRDDIEGTGIGLAIVKKAISRYGGIIHLDSDEGKGASFTFSWPKNLREKSKTPSPT